MSSTPPSATVSVGEAARLLGINDAQVRYRVAKGSLRTAAPRHGGSRALAVVLDSVLEERRKLLARLGAAEPCERCAAGDSNQATDASVRVLQEEIDRLSEVVRLGLVIEAARADQLRLLLPSETMND